METSGESEIGRQDVSTCGGAAVDGEGEGFDGDRWVGGGAEREGGADWTLQQDAEGDPEGSRRRGLPQGGGELHEAPAERVQRGGGLGSHRETAWLRPGRGTHRRGSG